MTQNGYETYRAVDTTTADPVTLTTMLYEGALKAIRRARLFAGGDRQKFAAEAERAHLIVGELLATLDMEQGELPRNLSAIYAYCIQRIIRASAGDVSGLDEAERHLARIADAWKAATASLREGTAETAEAVA